MSRRPAILTPLSVTIASVLIGGLFGLWGRPLLHSRMLPWVLSRGLGVAAIVALALSTGLGLWLRHPWRTRVRGPEPALLLRLHLTFTASAAVLTAGHVVAIALDGYAHVGWTGVLVPGASRYRTWAVAAGSAGLYLALLVALTAVLAGWLGGRVWLPIHRLGTASFVLVWVHGVLAGSDAVNLRPLYIGSGVVLGALFVSRRLAVVALGPTRDPDGRRAVPPFGVGAASR